MPPKHTRRIAHLKEEEEAPVQVRGGIMDQMRRRQKWFLVILASILLVPFGAYPIISQAMSGGARKSVGDAYGRHVSIANYEALRSRMNVALDVVREKYGALGGSQQVTPEEVWDRLVQLHEAETMGLVVTPAEEDEMLAFWFGTPGALDSKQLDQFLTVHPSTDEDQLRQAVSEDILVGGRLTGIRAYMTQMAMYSGQQVAPEELARLEPRLSRHLTATLGVTDDEAWAFYLAAQRKYEVSYAGVPADRLLKDVPAPSEQDLQKWFDDHKDTPADETADGIGYFLPERVRLDYFATSANDQRPFVTVNENEMKRFYEQNKMRYPASRPAAEAVVPIPASEPTATRAASRPGTMSAADPPPAAALAASKPASAPVTTTKAAEFKPYEEVRDEIRKTLLDQKAQKQALDSIQKAGNRREREEEGLPSGSAGLPAGQYANIAKTYHLRFVPAVGLVSAAQAMRISGLGDARDRSGRSIDQVLFGRGNTAQWDSVDLTDQAGNAYHVWITNRLKPTAQKLDDIREQVMADWKAFNGFTLAGDFVKKLLDEMKSAVTTMPSGDAGAVPALAAIEASHPDLIKDTTDEFTLNEVRDAPIRIAIDATDTARRRTVAGIFARRIESKDLRQGAADVIDNPVSRMQYVFVVSKRIDPSAVAFAESREMFRSEALQAKRQQFLRDWFENAKLAAKITLRPEEERGPVPDQETPRSRNY